MTDTFIALSPILLLLAGAVGMLLVDAILQQRGKTAGSLFRSRHSRAPRPYDPPDWGSILGRGVTSACIFGAAAVLSATLWFGGYLGEGLDVGGALMVDKLALFGFMLAALGGTLASLMSSHYLFDLEMDEGQFHPLMMLATSGAMLLAAASSFVMFFVALETLSLGVYILTGFRRASPRSTEGAVKYFLMGAFASAILLFGIAFMYGETGASTFEGVGKALAVTGGSRPLVMLGMVLMLVGMTFKVSAVPFHMWTPDAYQGAPTPATSYMAGVVKVAAFVVLLRFLSTSLMVPTLAGPPFGWASILAILSVITMFWGNMAALRQQNIKRMLAYSSIAHAGYILIGVVSMIRMTDAAIDGVLYYLFTYLAANAGAFTIVCMAVRNGEEANELPEFRGFGRRHPLLGAAMGVFLLSMLGLPPFAGFFGKLYIFSTAVESGLWLLAVLGMIASVVSAYYYIGVIVVMFMRESEDDQHVAVASRSGQAVAAVIFAFLLVLQLGLFPSPWLG
jgi:NADH-quinone oxidoreductase subunit N